ncbi:MAG: AIR synthase-related protein, partial [Firmicutes bacterium]|nr:AIR synthase-related protein [Bacillota bacterium]
LSQRMGIRNGIASDAAPLTEMVAALRGCGAPVHCLRDITRGGLATVLNEVAGIAASGAGLRAELEERALPVSDAVSGLCRILGLDPLTMGNEGKMLVAVPESWAGRALELIQKSRYGENAAVIGHFTEGSGVTLHTAIGGLRQVPPLSGEGLPRIC